VILYLVRHGETESNRAGLALGRADVPLNDHGRWQARQVGIALADEPLVAVYSSPLSRAFDTASEIARHHGLAVQVEEGLIEMNIGEADGLTYHEVRKRFPGLLEVWASEDGPTHPMPGGETLLEVQERAWKTIVTLLQKHPEEAVCAATHNFVILSLLARILDLPLAGFRRLRHDVGAISVVDVKVERSRIVRMNDDCHLRGRR
jgi:broad specificity phosphatase PhoE